MSLAWFGFVLCLLVVCYVCLDALGRAQARIRKLEALNAALDRSLEASLAYSAAVERMCYSMQHDMTENDAIDELLEGMPDVTSRVRKFNES